MKYFKAFVPSVAGKEWRIKKLKTISDRIFDKIKKQSDKEELSFEELYIATLLVFK